MNNYYQTIIIGAGPAGLTAGRYLKDSLILEAKSEIGKPVQCGEGISLNALKFQDIAPNPEWISIAFKSIDRIMPNGKVIGRAENEIKGYVIDRVKFERFLAKECEGRIKMNSRAIDLSYDGKNWSIKTIGGDKFESKYLIGADGPASIVARKIFGEKIKLCGAAEYLVETREKMPADRIEMHFGALVAPKGYAWIFPKSRRTANIGILCETNPNEKLKNFLEETAKNKFGAYKILENRSGAIPCGGPLKTLVKNNALAIGDAAGLTDPLFKGGMSQAMLSAKIAAECVLAGDPQSYEEKVRALPFSDPDLIKARDIFYSLNDEVLNELGNILHGKSASDFKNPEIAEKLLSSPVLAGRLPDIAKFFSVWQKSSDWLW